jgi:protein-L-isoaspartate(D-aspartate) O-methyltransferase
MPVVDAIPAPGAFRVIMAGYGQTGAPCAASRLPVLDENGGVRMREFRQLLAGLLCVFASSGLPAAQERSAERNAMVGQIDEMVAETAEFLGKKRLDDAVLEAMRTVPRHAFVPEDEQTRAYDNRPLSIGYGQTISQPYIVALMTDLLEVGPDASVLEVGTGSGYQAAVLSGLVTSVRTIEIVPQLGERAQETLQRLGYENVEVRIGDGYYGWQEQAPYDAIIVTAAASHVPPPLLRQLKPGGRMLIPVGSRFMVQELLLVEKTATGEVSTRQILPVRFVPLTGGH